MNKILIITPGGMPVPSVKGGAVQNLIELLVKENQNDKKNIFTIISPYESEAEKKAIKDYPNTNFKFIKIPKLYENLDLIVYKFAKNVLRKKQIVSFRNNFKYLYFSIATAKILKKDNYDRVIIENNVRNFWAFKLHKNFKKYNGKYYFHIHNVIRGNAGNKKIINKCKRFLCVSNYISNKMINSYTKFGKIEKKQLFVLKNCIDLKKFKKISNNDLLDRYRLKYNISKDDIVILYAGRLNEQKGVLETIKAIKKTNDKRVKLLIVGSCFYEMKIESNFEKKLIEEASDIKERIIFTGYIPYEQMPIIYNLAYLSVLPSLSIEAAGLTIIESMACGTPVITTNVGGIPEYTNKECSYIINVNNRIIDNISKIINDLKEDSELRNNLSKKSMQFVKDFNAKKYYSNFLKSIEIDYK